MSVMNRPSSSSRIPARTSALSLLLAAGLATSAQAQPWHWNTDSGNWNTAGNWIQLAPPALTADVFIGSTPAAFNGIVSLNTSPEVANLSITNGMALFTLNRSIRVNGNTVLSGSNVLPDGRVQRSELRVGSTDGVSFITDSLFIANGGRLMFANDAGGYATVQDWANVDADSFISGNGVLSFLGGGSTLVNNGTLSPGSIYGLRLQQFGGGRFDLDGTSGDGRLSLSTYDDMTNTGASLRLDGVGLTDSFSGRVLIGPSSDLFMNLDEGWVADASSELISSVGGVVGGPFPNNLSVIRGGALDFSGLLRAGFASGEGRELAVRSSEITLRPAARVEVSANSLITLGGVETNEVLVEGGEYTIGQNGELHFPSPTEVRGGTFTTTSEDPTDGRVEFNGATTYNGEVNFNGFVRQNGDSTVSGPSVINATTFDMDGFTGNTVWNVHSTLVVNAQSIDLGPPLFDGTLNIEAGFLGRLTLNVADPDEAWQMRGTMNLAGSGGLPVTRVAGSHMHVTGDLNVTSGIAQITADTTFSPAAESSNISIPQDATLRMRGVTVVGANTSFAGAGTFQNGVNGEMVLDSGVSLSQVGLTNNSTLHIAMDAPGVASVQRFVSTSDALWMVDIGGHLAGTEHDLLLVTGGAATLDGVLNVSLLGLGEGATFTPIIGDEFTILMSLGGVGGMFTNDPVSQVGGLTYNWTVEYNPHTVVLRLDSIVPAPSSVALLGLGGLFAARRRHLS